ncbi:MAG: hypothetical protein WBS24_10645 [Terriglobales bacterium]
MRLFYPSFPLILLCLFTASAQEKPIRQQSPRQFVEGFYNWYVVHVWREHEPGDVALKFKSSSFSPELVRLLKADFAAQSRCAEIVGIDFDPYLGGQDLAHHYQVGEITQQGEAYVAAIYRIESGKRAPKPDVKAKFQQSNGKWVFVDFIYPEDGSTLLKILQSPREKCTDPLPPKK